MRAFRNTFLLTRFFVLMGAGVIYAILAFAFPELWDLRLIIFIGLFGLIAIEGVILYSDKEILEATRRVSTKWSNGSEEVVTITINNVSNQSLHIDWIDEAPHQLNLRTGSQEAYVNAQSSITIQYTVRPTERGEYNFGRVVVGARSSLGLFQRKVVLGEPQTVACYPSIRMMKELQMKALSQQSTKSGIRQLRRLGHSYEFDQIKAYVNGDDYRSINWKATGRKGALMINHYRDERSQNIILIVDKGRNMQLPFGGLTLMDHSVNAALAISNICLRKDDRVGLISFSDKLGTLLPPSHSPSSMQQIMRALYNEKPYWLESDFALLYQTITRAVKRRSLLMLTTHFNSLSSAKRVIPYLKKINQRHLLVVMFFRNTAIEEVVDREVQDIRGVHTSTIAKDHLLQTEQIQLELRMAGIQTVLTTPEDLAVNGLNKYLELKSRGLV